MLKIMKEVNAAATLLTFTSSGWEKIFFIATLRTLTVSVNLVACIQTIQIFDLFYSDV